MSPDPEGSHEQSCPGIPASASEDATAPGAIAFNYGDLDPTLASEAQDAAKRIRSHLRTETLAAIEIGRDLLSIKERLSHAQFGMWTEAEFGWHGRTAQRYMLIAKEFGAKPDIVSDLPLTVVHQLAAPSMPLAVRENVLARAVAGESG